MWIIISFCSGFWYYFGFEAAWNFVGISNCVKCLLYYLTWSLTYSLFHTHSLSLFLMFCLAFLLVSLCLYLCLSLSHSFLICLYIYVFLPKDNPTYFSLRLTIVIRLNLCVILFVFLFYKSQFPFFKSSLQSLYRIVYRFFAFSPKLTIRKTFLKTVR